MRQPLFILIGLVAMLAAACGGGGGDADRQPAPTAADSPIATPAGPVAEMPCQVPDDIKSYRFSYSTKLDMPGPELGELREELEEAIEAAQQEGRDVFAELAESGEGWGGLVLWLLLLSDTRMEGAFVAPDRVEVRATFLGVLESTVISMGDKQWIKRGASDWEESTGELAEGLPFTTDLCEGYTSPEAMGLEPREETVNGVATLHYRLDEADFRRLAELFAVDGEGMSDVEDLPQEGTVDVWLAKEGNWPVRMEGEFTLEYGEIGGPTLWVSMFMEVKDLNDPSIKIEPPVPTLMPTTEPPGTTDRSPPAGGRGGPGVPMFRGNPARTGVNPGPGVERSPTLLWRFRTRAPVKSSPAVVEGMVYIGSFDDYVYALDAATGEEIWRFEASSSVSSSPAVVDGAVYIGVYPGHVYGLDAATGEERWRFQTDDYVDSSPAVVDGVVYVGGFRELYAIDAGTGEERWRFQTGRMSSSPAVVDGAVYIGSWDDVVYALEAATGKELWRFETGGGVYSSPAVAHGVVYVGSGDDYAYALDAATGEERWRSKTGRLAWSSPAVADGAVYIGSEDGYVYALDAATGRERWRFGTGGAVASSPTVVDGVLYIGGSEVHLYALDAATGEERWRFEMDLGRDSAESFPAVESSPAVVDGVVYVGSNDEYVYAITEG